MRRSWVSRGGVSDSLPHFCGSPPVLIVLIVMKAISDGVRALWSRPLSSSARLVNILCRHRGGCLGLLVSSGRRRGSSEMSAAFFLFFFYTGGGEGFCFLSPSVCRSRMMSDFYHVPSIFPIRCITVSPPPPRPGCSSSIWEPAFVFQTHRKKTLNKIDPISSPHPPTDLTPFNVLKAEYSSNIDVRWEERPAK